MNYVDNAVNHYRALLEAVTNIVLNYILGKYFGINGIIAATLISLFLINFCYGSQLIYRYYYTDQRMSQYYISHAKCAAATFAVCAVSCWLCSLIPETVFGFACKMILCVIVPNLLYFAIYRRTNMYRESVPWLLEKIKIAPGGIVWKLLLG